MTVKAEIIAIGDELLYGQTLDTNSHWISGALDAINIKVYQKSTIGDNRDQILKSFEEAKQRADIVLITGGLGPTKDDLTKPLLAEYFGVGLKRNDEALQELTDLFFRTGRELSDLNKAQADLPTNCTKITNEMGTAAGMWFEEDETVFISMPGVPYEMKHMMEHYIIPMLKDKFTKGELIHKIIKTIGIGESDLAIKIEKWEDTLPDHIKLAYLPTMGQVKLRLTATGGNAKQLEQDTDALIEAVMPIIQPYVYGYGDDEIESVVGNMLKTANKTIATAESCTGGYVAHLLTSIPGSSAYFKGSIVSYSNDVKVDQLNVPNEDLENYGAVSEEVVKAMAKNVRLKLGSDVGLATTGIAGPDGGTDEKPVGTVWIAYADATQVIAKKMNFSKRRKYNIHWSALAVLNLFRQNFNNR
ncbi:MAG: competence/damage-inducible protein A [Cyclobacteriaceae bacterium]